MQYIPKYKSHRNSTIQTIVPRARARTQSYAGHRRMKGSSAAEKEKHTFATTFPTTRA